ncbi:MAG TPA: hypothetical protein VLF94_02685 [Chlamydiales bacterium]|nr:hypothetical protein [Chlamydiales bacterium]
MKNIGRNLLSSERWIGQKKERHLPKPDVLIWTIHSHIGTFFSKPSNWEIDENGKKGDL